MVTWKKVALGSMLVLPAAVLLFCGSAGSPVAAEKNGRIWTEAGAAPAVVPAGFSPTASFAPLVKRLKPAVVNISTTTEVQGRRFLRRGPSGSSPFELGPEDLFRRFFGDRFEMSPQRRSSLGSGFIINADGYILTNNHVVDGATEIRVRLTDPERELTARVVGKDERYDLALIKVDTKDPLPVVPLGDSDALEVGDWVIAIGSPFGLSHTVTAGIVSAKDRVIGAGPFDDFIQTDASINPGNSGGPLFDSAGNVVGINTAIHAAAQGIGFAVPVNMAKKFVRDVLEKGRVARGWLGVGIQELTPNLARSLGIPESQGVLVSQVFPGSPAEKAGLQRGDVILSVDGRPTDDPTTLTRTIGLAEPGREITLQVRRNGKDRTLRATIAERSEDGSPSEKGEGPEVGSLGLDLAPLTDREAARLDLPKGQGLKVRDVDEEGPAAGTGIRPGDILLEMNRQPVGSLEDVQQVLSRASSGDQVLLLVLRGHNYFYVVIQKP
ncbi:MAG TPA: DegQ family serine endoprotease [Myxococcota bacterium]|nr:DegQ family serine endoprotease [Myxococcota bacterium]HQK49622.1 DegQ family serine endoprotease [Myxococcota bacterium]